MAAVAAVAVGRRGAAAAAGDGPAGPACLLSCPSSNLLPFTPGGSHAAAFGKGEEGEDVVAICDIIFIHTSVVLVRFMQKSRFLSEASCFYFSAQKGRGVKKERERERGGS